MTPVAITKLHITRRIAWTLFFMVVSLQLAFPTTISCRSIRFQRYPPGFQTGSSGCVFPLSSVARTANEYRPGDFAVHDASQVRKEYAPWSSPSFAAIQVFPWSSETSTKFTRPNPLKAMPCRVTLIPAGIFENPSGEMMKDRTGNRSIGTVLILPAFTSSGVVFPRGVSGTRYPVFIQKFSSGALRTRIQVRHLVQQVAKYPGTTRRA